MNIEGPKKLIKRAAFAARLLGVHAFSLNISYDKDANYCIRHDDGSFTIAVAEDTHKELLIDVVAHEMVHLRQYKHDLLWETDEGNIVYWKGQPYPNAGPDSDDYWLSPWEMEARALQEWIAYRWEER